MIYGRKKLDAPLPSPRGSYDGVAPLIRPQERSQSMGVVVMDTIRGLGPLEECDTDLESQVNNCSDGGGGGGGGDGVMSPEDTGGGGGAEVELIMGGAESWIIH